MISAGIRLPAEYEQTLELTVILRELPKDDIYLVRRRYSLRRMVKNLQLVRGEPLR
jgi:hypothetical protein